ncbi:MAG: SDR family oxidoreductase [Acidimicrobiia bacterium]|nr:SDR family oxidoreductase [Acidimicrobiia bacterium]
MPTARRTALVTGGAGGMGREICRTLAASAHDVAVADLDGDAALAVADEVGGLGVRLDVTDEDSVGEAVATVSGTCGPIGICVNAAGWDRFLPFLDTDSAFCERVLAVNLAGPMRVCRYVLPHMVDLRWGRIVNIASDAGRVGSSLEAVYSGAKGGLIAFTKTIAREFARHGVTANSVCPGVTDTPLLDAIKDENPAAARVLAAVERSTPLGRIGLPQDIAPAVDFLCSDAAGFVTGQTLSVSGGLTMA